MSEWWDDDDRERYWLELTHREDIGSDLKAPQRDESRKDYWSYSLINQVRPGDAVYHYSGRVRAFVGASVAGAPLEERDISWAPRGNPARTRTDERDLRPAWGLPLYRYMDADPILTLAELRDSAEQEWIRA